MNFGIKALTSVAQGQEWLLVQRPRIVLPDDLKTFNRTMKFFFHSSVTVNTTCPYMQDLRPDHECYVHIVQGAHVNPSQPTVAHPSPLQPIVLLYEVAHLNPSQPVAAHPSPLQPIDLLYEVAHLNPF